MFFNENKPYFRPIMQFKIVTCVCQIYSVYYIIVRSKDIVWKHGPYIMMEINLKFIWRPAGGAWCKVKWLFVLIDGGYLDGDVALNEQIDVIAAEVANENDITGFPCIHCEKGCKTQHGLSQDIPTLSMLMFCQHYQMKLKNYLLLPSHR